MSFFLIDHTVASGLRVPESDFTWLVFKLNELLLWNQAAAWLIYFLENSINTKLSSLY